MELRLMILPPSAPNRLIEGSETEDAIAVGLHQGLQKLPARSCVINTIEVVVHHTES
jgi:hypothetical protein